MLLHTQAERGPVGLTGPIVIPVSCQRTRSFELVGGKGFEPGPTVSLHVPTRPVRHNLPVTWRALFSRQAQNKKAF